MSHLTLIITELSRLGIVMVGDTAQTVDSVTPRGTIQDRAFYGLIKVLPVQMLQAGVSYWGWAKMPPDDDNGRWMDWWLQDFIDRRRNEYNTLYDFAQLLETELRELVPQLSVEELREAPSGNGGIHLAGFVNVGRTREPCFWHIHNGQSQALPHRRIDPRVVNANFDCPSLRFRQLSRLGQSHVTRNGDIEAYVTFFEGHFTDYVRELNERLQIVMPLPTLGHRAEFWSAQIKFISALYEVGGVIENGVVRQMTKGIGDQVTTLTIASGGIRSYYTR
ncbi:hypothetical protein MUO83_07590 [Candidatus Bathyarchaeota archaeon]|nr:hypothetical protein [Candidatus Bathyarchaeota archaeon]